FLPTPISVLPSGDEQGQFLAIDIGGSNLRVGFVELIGHIGRDVLLRGSSPPRFQRIFEKEWPIGEHLKNEHADDLFAWIGDCIAEVVSDSLEQMQQNGLDMPKELSMGVTFSFPMT